MMLLEVGMGYFVVMWYVDVVVVLCNSKDFLFWENIVIIWYGL